MNILVAYDGSDSAHRALDRAATLAEDGARVAVVGVAEGTELCHHLAEAGTILAAKGIAASFVERKGEAASMIVDEAEKEHADVIVMGTRGHHAVKRWLLGSVSSKVLHDAPCDVVVVR